MNTKHTPGPLRVIIESTCSAAWPTIVQDCVDPETNEIWPRQVGQAENSHLETKEAREGNGDIGTYDEMPHRFALADDGEEALANAKLWATAPELLEALEGLYRIIDFQIHPVENNPIRHSLNNALAAIKKATE